MKIFYAIKRLLDIFLKKILVFLSNLLSLIRSSQRLLQIKLSTIMGVGSDESRHSKNMKFLKTCLFLKNALKYGADVWTDIDLFTLNRRNQLCKNINNYITPDTGPIECYYSQTKSSDSEDSNTENSVNEDKSDGDKEREDVDILKDISQYENAPDACSRTHPKRKPTADDHKHLAKRRRDESYEQSYLESDIEKIGAVERTSTQIRDSVIKKVCTLPIGFTLSTTSSNVPLESVESASKQIRDKTMHNISTNTGQKYPPHAQHLPVGRCKTTDKTPCSEKPIGVTRAAGNLTMQENIRLNTKLNHMQLEGLALQLMGNTAMSNFVDMASKLDDIRSRTDTNVPPLERCPNERPGIIQYPKQNIDSSERPTAPTVGDQEEKVDSKIPDIWNPETPERTYSIYNPPEPISGISDSPPSSQSRSEMGNEGSQKSSDIHPDLRHHPGEASDSKKVKKDSRYQKKFYRQERENRERRIAEGIEVHEERHPIPLPDPNIPGPSHQSDVVMNEIPNYTMAPPRISRPFAPKLNLANKSPLDMKTLKYSPEPAKATDSALSAETSFCYSPESVTSNVEDFEMVNEQGSYSSSSQKSLICNEPFNITNIRFWFEVSLPPCHHRIYCRDIMDFRNAEIDLSLKPFFAIQSGTGCSESEISIDEYLLKLRELQKLYYEIMYSGFQQFDKYDTEIITHNIPMRHASASDNYNMHEEISVISQDSKPMMEISIEEDNSTVFTPSSDFKSNLAFYVASNILNIGSYPQPVKEMLHSSEYPELKRCMSRNTSEDRAGETFRKISKKSKNYLDGKCSIEIPKELSKELDIEIDSQFNSYESKENRIIESVRSESKKNETNVMKYDDDGREDSKMNTCKIDKAVTEIKTTLANSQNESKTPPSDDLGLNRFEQLSSAPGHLDSSEEPESPGKNPLLSENNENVCEGNENTDKCHEYDIDDEREDSVDRDGGKVAASFKKLKKGLKSAGHLRSHDLRNISVKDCSSRDDFDHKGSLHGLPCRKKSDIDRTIKIMKSRHMKMGLHEEKDEGDVEEKDVCDDVEEEIEYGRVKRKIEFEYIEYEEVEQPMEYEEVEQKTDYLEVEETIEYIKDGRRTGHTEIDQAIEDLEVVEIIEYIEVDDSDQEEDVEESQEVDGKNKKHQNQ